MPLHHPRLLSASPVSPGARSLRGRLAALLGALLLAAVLPAAQAEKGDRDEQLNYAGDSGHADLAKQVYVLKGNVVLTKGSIVIKADEAELKRSPEGYASAVVLGAQGRLAQFHQKREGVDETIEGQAERIEYDARTDTVRFVNQAQMRRFRAGALVDELAGNLITYDNNTEIFRAQGAGSATTSGTGQVRGVIGPREGSAAAPAKPASAAGGKP